MPRGAFRFLRSLLEPTTWKQKAATFAPRYASIWVATAQVVTFSLAPLKQFGLVVVSRSLPIRGSGTDVTLNSTDLTRLPYDNSFPEMLIQLPGAVRGANGVVHINGDHGVINYQINGVALPQGLNRDIGSEIDLNDLSYVDVIEGAYPAQYGLKFGSVSI